MRERIQGLPSLFSPLIVHGNSSFTSHFGVMLKLLISNVAHLLGRWRVLQRITSTNGVFRDSLSVWMYRAKLYQQTSFRRAKTYRVLYPNETWRCKRGWFHPWIRRIPLEQEMAICSSFLDWKIPWTEEPMRSQGIGHHWECTHHQWWQLAFIECLQHVISFHSHNSLLWKVLLLSVSLLQTRRLRL